MTQIVLSPEGAAMAAIQSVEEEQEQVIRTGVVFGRERSGLTNDEVALADSIIAIPTFKHFSSLNLAQAVNIVCFEMWKSYQVKREGAESEGRVPDVWLHPRDGERLARRGEIEPFLQVRVQQLRAYMAISLYCWYLVSCEMVH
jgi:tRNA C32,U32 (ribose-2'-O)-methylase TrmJ